MSASTAAHPLKGLRDIYTELPTFGDYLVAGAKLLIAAFFVALTWWAVNRLTADFEDHGEIVERRNGAYLVVRVGMVLGQGLALTPLVGALSDDSASDFLWLSIGGLAIGLVYAVGIQPLLDTLLFGKPRSFNRLRHLGVARAVVVASFYVADGLIIVGALSGSAPSLGVAIGATIIFALLGFATLAVIYLLVGARYGMRRAVKQDGNVAAAVILGSIVISLGLILKKSITGDWMGLGSGIVGFLVYAVAGVVALLLLIIVLDKLILGQASVREIVKQDNYHAAVAMAAIAGVTALLISAVNVV